MNPLKNIQERMAEKKQALETEQLQRIERLRELEEAKNKKGFHIPNPVKAVKNKKEMSTLRKEIAAYEEKKQDKKVLIGCGIAFAIILIISGLMAFVGGENTHEKTVEDTSTVSAIVSVDEESNEEITSSVSIVDTVKQDAETVKQDETSLEKDTFEVTSAEDKPVNVDETPIVSEIEEKTELSIDEGETEDEEWPEDVLRFTAEDIDISTLTDYVHISTETIILGNGEGAKIEIKAPESMTYDDLLVYYEEDCLNVNLTDTVLQNGKTVFKLYVTGKKQGYHDLIILTMYDLYTKGDAAMGYTISVNKLDNTDGRAVYVTPTGEKYHFSSSCAGENAVRTTYYDASAYEYDPCGKCAN